MSLIIRLYAFMPHIKSGIETVFKIVIIYFYPHLKKQVFFL